MYSWMKWTIYSFFYADWKGFYVWEDAPRVSWQYIWSKIESSMSIEGSVEANRLKKDANDMVKGWPERTLSFVKEAHRNKIIDDLEYANIESLLFEWHV